MLKSIKNASLIAIKDINDYSYNLSIKTPITNVYGTARTILACGTLVTFLVNDTAILFPNIDERITTNSSPLDCINIFYWLRDDLGLAKIITLLVLLLVISGWRPRIMGIPHWIITFGFLNMTPTIDGGDQISAILAFFLIPFCLLDNRKWHWDLVKKKDQNSSSYLNISLWMLSWLIRIQVCIIYFHAGVGKLGVVEWADGTAVYYWFNNNIFGAPNWLKPAVLYLFSFSTPVLIVSWGTILFEILLSMAIMMKRTKYNWVLFLILGILFHLGIVIIHGLISFYFAMVAALILYLVPLDKEIDFTKFLPKLF